ncbi:uncharacterized protein CBL_06214 [Carabus blaptoides fortunei]
MVFFATFSNGELPEYIKVCKRSDPDLYDCISNSVETLKPKLRKGIPELNVPSMEPLPLGTLALNRGPQSARVDFNITNLLVWGPSSFIIKSMNHDIPNYRFAFKVLLPKLHFKGQYSINMNVLLLKLKGRGLATGNITNYFGDVNMQGHKIIKDEKEYLQFDKLNIKLKVGQTRFKLDNLFNGNPALGTLANDVINQNSDLFIEEIKPALEKSMSDIFTEAANNILNKFTFDELFPE